MINTTPSSDGSRLSGEDRRAAILNTAIGLIGEQGFSGFSINLLAKRCGMTTPGLLHHFGSKELLTVAVLAEGEERDRQAVKLALSLRDNQEVTRETVVTVLRAIVARNMAQPQLTRMNALARAEALLQGTATRAYFNEREKRVRAVIARLVEPFVDDAPATALQIMAMMNGLEACWLRDDCDFDLVAAWDAVATKIFK